MPISDMWQDGNGLDTMGEIDSNGSCDSVVSFNSCVSDESMEYLSAEERACLMYLEETIQSLDTEDDSGLSNDESDQLPARGNVANKAAHLSSSTELNKLPQDVPKSPFEGPLSYSSLVQNEILNYMVPTPFVLANHNSRIQTKPELAASQKKTAPKVACESNQLHEEALRVPSEASVVVIPPPYKIKGSKDTAEEQQNNHQPENVARRGPLSYEALIHLRKSASMRRTNATEAKTEEQQVSTNKDHEGSISTSQTHTQNSQAMTSRNSKPTPPPVAPKPKMKTPHKVPMNQEGDSNSKINSTMPYPGVLSVDKLMNPEKVRVEALCKLGLLKDAKNPICQQLKHSQSPANKEQNQTTSERLAPSVPARPGEQINQPVQSCSTLHQRCDLSTASSHPQNADITSTGTSATLEHTGIVLSGSNITVLNAISQNHQSGSSTVGTKNHFADTQMDSNESVSTKTELHVSSRSKGVNVPVPSIGRDRREALRKLGLLKN
ncbi:specifically androgen-regulated gene protein-like isoform X1 [Sinocyclocheilus anshuiensis]|uniref:Specifically androgen-regulated gene protein-like n=2 Tax=Sinocyclocheilus anshuiensis TaxID=1608454 RepID=A0A671L1Z4_9TELE|nr:PREDICTED: specifically androgen-regulated gene protein-like isoform X1 [Sinocyclocheilus anshuiensis]